MKHSLKAIRSMATTLLLIIVFQAPVLAKSNDNTIAPSVLGAGEIIGCFVLLLLVILAPLVKTSKKTS